MAKLIRNKTLLGVTLFVGLSSYKFDSNGEASLPDEVADKLLELKNYTLVSTQETPKEVSNEVTEEVEEETQEASEVVEEVPEEPSDKPKYTKEDLEPKTVRELESIIDELNLPVKKSLKRADMMNAILECL